MLLPLWQVRAKTRVSVPRPRRRSFGQRRCSSKPPFGPPPAAARPALRLINGDTRVREGGFVSPWHRARATALKASSSKLASCKTLGSASCSLLLEWGLPCRIDGRSRRTA